jgi:hypothetical protein
MNKESELFYLSKFQELCPSFPPGEIYPDERPDFRVRGANGDVGIEVTNFGYSRFFVAHTGEKRVGI